MPENIHSKVLILGSGPAGYTAAIYTTRAMLDTSVIQGIQPGGQLTITTDVENYPGFAETIQGPFLMEEMEKQTKKLGAKVITDNIIEVNTEEKPFQLKGESGKIYTCDALIISTGAKARWLGLESESKFNGYGVSACATCDGFFFKNKKVIVVGGGNTAAEEALYLSNITENVKIIHRRNSLRSDKILQKRLNDEPKIEILWDSILEEVYGDESPKKVTGVKIKNIKTNNTSDLAVDGVFIAIGHDPSTELFKGKIKMDNDGYILTEHDSTKTNVPGIFAAGDVKDKIFRQAVTAAGLGCMAALETEKYLANNE